jgi:RNA polymerase sigma-70 factor (ECF subfamily)
MDELLAELCAHAAGGAPALRNLREAEGAALAAALSQLVARGRAEWPAVPVEPRAVVAQAARHMPDAELADAPRARAAVESLHAGDLHLACGCAAGTAAALDAFERAFLDDNSIAPALARIDRSPIFADDVRQAVREKLFVEREGAPARVSAYSGRSPLRSWLRVIATRTAIDLRRVASAGVATTAELSAEELAVGGSPELRYLKERYGKAFEEAVRAAFAALDDEQVNLLRLQIVDGLRTAQIAALFSRDRSTIKRRIAACREQLLERARRHLMSALRLSPAEFESLAGLVQSQLHVSLDRLLRDKSKVDRAAAR